MIRARCVGASAVLLVTLAGCTAGGQTVRESTASVAPSTSASASPESGPAIKTTRQVRGVDIEVAVHPVEVKDDLSVLVVDYRVAPESVEAFDDKVGNLDAVLGDLYEADNILVVDGEQGAVSSVDGDLGVDGAAVFDEEHGDDGFVGQSRTVFAAPQGDSVDVLLPSLGYVVDVPVVAAGELFDSVTGELSDHAEPAAREMRALERAYDASSTTDEQGDEVQVTLASDVLFESSSADLSGRAAAVVGGAADQVQGYAEGGTVSVIGHTDDVDTDEFNQKLSEERADAVASRLQTKLGDAYKVSAEGRGESEPVAEGTDPDARAANRRVEIRFKGNAQPETDGAAASIPKTEAPTGTAGEALAVEPKDGMKYEVSADSVTRSAGSLFGTLSIELVEGDGGGTMGGLLVADPSVESAFEGRGLSPMERALTAKDLTLLTGQGHVYPLDFEMSRDEDRVERRIVADRDLAWMPEEAGDVSLVTGVWPDIGQDTVTLEVPGKFRITDIPVVDGVESD